MRKLSADQIEEMKTRYLMGENLTQLAIAYKVSRPAISGLLKRRNIPIRSSGMAHRKYSLNEQFFENIDNEAKAYWLGFLCADGTVKDDYLSVSVACHDKEILEKFSMSLESTYPIRDYHYPQVEFCRVFIRNKRLVEALKHKGVIENKTMRTEFPNVPDRLLHHFMRGYFDGDGSITAYKVKNSSCRIGFSINRAFTVTGYLAFIKTYQRKLMEHCDLKETRLSTRHKENPLTVTLTYSGRKQLTKIYAFLFNNATVYLKRKKLRFEQVINLNASRNIACLGKSEISRLPVNQPYAPLQSIATKTEATCKPLVSTSGS